MCGVRYKHDGATCGATMCPCGKKGHLTQDCDVIAVCKIKKCEAFNCKTHCERCGLTDHKVSTCPHIIAYKWGEIENQPWQQMSCGVSHFHQQWPFGQGCPDCRKDKEKKPENQRRRLAAEAAQADDGFEVQKRYGFARHRDHGQLRGRGGRGGRNRG